MTTVGLSACRPVGLSACRPVGLSACVPAYPLTRLPASVRLMLMRPHRPYRLQRQQVSAAFEVAVPVLGLGPEVDELALPPGQIRDDPPLGVLHPAGRLHVVI